MPPASGQDHVIDLTEDTDDSGIPHVANSDSDDEDLKLAIALSLSEQNQNNGTEQLTVNATEADSVKSHDKSKSQTKPSATINSTDRTIPVLSTLDRKGMEAERLARLKRKRESDNADRPKVPAAGIHELPPTCVRPPHATKSASSTFNRSVPQAQDHIPSEIEEPKSQEGLRSFVHKADAQISHFPCGKVLRTASMQRSLGSDDSISFQNLIKPLDDQSYLKSTLLSSFVADFDWLLPHFDTKKVSFVIVLNAQGAYHKQLLERDFEGIKNVRLVIPENKGVSYTQHSKLVLLFYESKDGSTLHPNRHARCRVVIPSANLVPHDWGIGEIMENMLFVIDLPKRDIALSGNHTSPSQRDESRTEFEEGLRAMLIAMGVPVEVLARLDAYDFSATADIGFVASIGGSNTISGQSLPDTTTLSRKPFTNVESSRDTKPAPTSVRSGLLSLSDAVASLGFGQALDDVDGLPKLDYIASSLGALKPHYLSSVLVSACGRADKYLVQLCPSGRKTNPLDTAEKLYQSALNALRIYFPSDPTVRSSRGGPSSAGTICLSTSTWNATGQSKFPRELMRDYTRFNGDQMLMHSKVLYVRFARPQFGCSSRLAAMSSQSPGEAKSKHDKKMTLFAGWAYVGSANLSESAWGSVVVDKKSNTSRITCRNWESGVVIPVPISTEVQRRLDDNPALILHDLSLHEVFGHIIPVPLKEPAQTYDDGRQPWFYRD